MDYQPMDQSSSNKTWYLIGAVVVIAVLALGYFYSTQSPAVNMQPSAVENNQVAPVSEGTTIADIQADLNQTPDGSAALNADADASAQAVQGL